MIKKILQKHLPSSLKERLYPYWEKYKETKFHNQKSIQIQIYEFKLEIPENHSLPGLMAAEPYRDLCVGIMAKHVCEKYPTHAVIDIGANVGDTAAMLAHHCRNPLVLVEGSDFFFKFLEVNSAKLNNACELKKAIISDGASMAGSLSHWGGTAELKSNTDAPPMETVALGDITEQEVCLIKTDTDGHDYKILDSGMQWLSARQPALIFESQIRTDEDLTAARALFSKLAAAGYEHFIIWDSSGYHMTSTSDLDVVYGIHRYLLKVQQHNSRNNSCNFDVACFHTKDRDIYDKVARWWSTY